jgi:hypothetical protein
LPRIRTCLPSLLLRDWRFWTPKIPRDAIPQSSRVPAVRPCRAPSNAAGPVSQIPGPPCRHQHRASPQRGSRASGGRTQRPGLGHRGDGVGGAARGGGSGQSHYGLAGKMQAWLLLPVRKLSLVCVGDGHEAHLASVKCKSSSSCVWTHVLIG